MGVGQLLKKTVSKLTGAFREKPNDITRFKSEIWQTDEISKAFIKGSDAATIPAAEIMDKEVNDFFLTHCSTSESVLDIGCGHGIVSEFLAESGVRVSAVDISEKLLDDLRLRTKDRNLPLEIKRGDAYNIPYGDNHFDVVVARMFLPHFPDWPVVLKEMTRVTRPGGKLLVHFSSAENTELGKKLGTQECVFASSPVSTDGWVFYAETDSKELHKVAASLGLTVMDRTPVSFFLHNRLLGYALGSDGYRNYMEKVQQFFEDEKVRDFAVWFDKTVIAHCSPALSHFNIIHFKKLD